jgi:lysophospholipase L1-like esterase
MNPRAAASSLALSVLGLTVGLALGEVSLRAYRAFKTEASGQPTFIERDTLLGWRAKANYQVRYPVKNADGEVKMVPYSSVTGGFRLYGNTESRRLKVLVIGDSFTQATNVATEETYPALLAKALDAEVFSYGALGFGTLQELMVLQHVIKVVDPDVVLLQFCTNDFINNSFTLESNSILNTNRATRPYLTSGGAVFYKNPAQSSNATSWIAKSQLMALLATRLHVPRTESIETVIGRDPRNRDFQESVRVTRILLARFSDVVGSERKMFIFLADGGRTRFRTLPGVQAYSRVGEKALLGILASLPITFIGGIPEAVAEAEASGLSVTAADGAHWSELGHRTVASALAERLRVQLAGVGHR